MISAFFAEVWHRKKQQHTSTRPAASRQPIPKLGLTDASMKKHPYALADWLIWEHNRMNRGEKE